MSKLIFFDRPATSPCKTLSFRFHSFVCTVISLYGVLRSLAIYVSLFLWIPSDFTASLLQIANIEYDHDTITANSELNKQLRTIALI
jgi:hypothetical protein